MKKFLTKLCVLLLCLPALLFCACSNDPPSKLPAINIATYYNQTAKVTYLSEEESSGLAVSSLTEKDVDKNSLGQYVQIELLGNRTWLYKMYIDYITFYVYTNESRNVDMIVNVSISNVADENDRSNPETFTTGSDSPRFKPTANGATLCTVKVGKVVANATGEDKITFDILNSVNDTMLDANKNPTNFRWTIYGLTIYGESRSYSK